MTQTNVVPEGIYQPCTYAHEILVDRTLSVAGLGGPVARVEVEAVALVGSADRSGAMPIAGAE